MHVLITGAAGFAGRYVLETFLAQTNWRLTALARSTPSDVPVHARVHSHTLDLLNAARVREVIEEVKPDAIVHLAAQSHVPTAWEHPWATFEANVHGQLNLFSAVIASGIKPRILVVSSNEVYGAPEPGDLPLRENNPMRPGNPYAVSKVAQDMMALQYFRSHQLDVMVARPFNHIGPRQSNRFVVPSFAARIAEIELGRLAPELLLGNMTAARDFTDVRDVARAYRLLIDKGVAGEIYNVCSGVARSIQSVLDQLLTFTPVKITQTSDPSQFRRADTPSSYGDRNRLTQATGWQPEIPFDQTLRDVLEYERATARAKS
jgi:GDP-4-dehydro-6-deoxy-D-mannose reductase